MVLDKSAFTRVGELLAEGKYPTSYVAYSGAEIVKDGNRKVPVVWFTCRDRKVFPRRGQRVAVTEDFRIAFTKPLVFVASVTTSSGTRRFHVACSKSGRTVTPTK